MPFHKDYTEYNNHTPVAFLFADDAARDATDNPYTEEPYESDDLYKFALKQDDNTLWMLTATTPTWSEVGSGSGDTFYTADGTLTSARTVQSYQGNTLLFEHFDTADDFFNTRGQVSLSDLGWGVQISAGDGSGAATSYRAFNININGMVIDDTTASKGLENFADYSANFTDHSLITRLFADTLFTAGRLGGEMTSDITFTGDDTYDLTFGSTTNADRFDNINLLASTNLNLDVGVTGGDRFFFSILSGLNLAQFGYFDDVNSNFMGIQYSTTAFTFQDGVNGKGIVYGGDYSPSYDDRSLVDKGYVDGLVSDNSIYDADGFFDSERTLDFNANVFNIVDNASETAASGTLTFTGVPANGDTITINGKTIDWVNNLNEFANNSEIARSSLITAEDAATVFEAFINATQPGDGIQFWKDQSFPVSATRVGAVVTITADQAGEAGNSIDTTASTSATWGDSTLTGGTDNDVMTFSLTDITMHYPVIMEDGLDLTGDLNITGGDVVMDFGRHTAWKVTSFPDDLWEIDASGGQQNLNFTYSDAGTPSNIIQFNQDGRLIMTANGDIQIPARSDTSDYWLIGVEASSNGLSFRYYDDATTTTNENLFIGGGAGNVTFRNNLVLGDGAQLRIPADLTANDQWRFDGGNGDDNFEIIYYDDDGGGNTTLFHITPAGLLEYGSDLSGSYTNRTVVDKEYVDDTAAAAFTDQEPITVRGPDSTITVTGTEQQITLSATGLDGSVNEYQVLLGANEFNFDNADGSKIYEVTYRALFDVNNQVGDTRSYGRIKAQLEGTDIADSEMNTYVREFQGTTNGKPNTGMSCSFFVQPAADETLSFVVWGSTDTGSTLVDFDLTAFSFSVKRVK